MSCEQTCPNCSRARKIQTGEVYRHRYGMIAVNFDPPFIQRTCTTSEERSYEEKPVCDRPEEFVAKGIVTE